MPWRDFFRDAVVVVTGASSGIGRATAIAFGASGARVVLVARRRTELEEVAREIRANGGAALVLPADVTNPRAVRDVLEQTLRHHGRVDVVINNAGVLIPSTVVELERSDLMRMLDVNLFGALWVLQESVCAMRAQADGGVIVNVASLAGRRGVSPLGGYCASKFALVGLTEALRMELHGTRVHVGLVLPGVVETPMAHGSEAELETLWPEALNMPVAWVVWAIFAAARFRLVEIAVPPGAATLEKIAALAPGVADSMVYWGTQATGWLAGLLRR
ncbi:SDR family oxidoreductase [Candidatus Binatia bacterium]|nr:SDR family oxidoreductase [Candidatus Binatia bacterium]